MNLIEFPINRRYCWLVIRTFSDLSIFRRIDKLGRILDFDKVLSFFLNTLWKLIQGIKRLSTATDAHKVLVLQLFNSSSVMTRLNSCSICSNFKQWRQWFSTTKFRRLVILITSIHSTFTIIYRQKTIVVFLCFSICSLGIQTDLRWNSLMHGSWTNRSWTNRISRAVNV